MRVRWIYLGGLRMFGLDFVFSCVVVIGEDFFVFVGKKSLLF